MPHKNPGLRKEEEYVLALNNKKVQDLNHNCKYLLREIFGPLEEEEVVYSNLVGGFQKPDFYIEYKFRRVFVSLKSGAAKILHQESIDTFIEFFEKCGMHKDCIDIFKLTYFGDGTLDGTGEERMSYSELQYRSKEQIQYFNKKVNTDKELVKLIVERCMFLGSKEGNIPADYIIFGDSNFSYMCSRKQVEKHIYRKSWLYMDNLHIGPLQFRPHARLLVKRENEEGRYKVDAWWANLESDIRFISERYNG